MKIGLGIICSRGRGRDCLSNHINSDYCVAAETIKDKDVLKGMRRADRFSKMTTIAANDAANDAGISAGTSETGIIVSTQFGPHASTFKFLDDILDYDDAETSPTIFSHSVHNAAAHYAATSLGCRGSATTLTLFDRPIAAALDLAYAWLNEGRVKNVIIGYVEERGPAMDYIINELKLKHGMDHAQEFRFEANSPFALSEGAVFLACSVDFKDSLPVIANDIRNGIIQSIDDLFNLVTAT